MGKHNVPALVGEVLKEIGETTATAGWDCHGTFVLLHKALERVAYRHRKRHRVQECRDRGHRAPGRQVRVELWRGRNL